MSVVAETWEQLKSIINAVLKDCLREIAEKTTLELKEYVLGVWYGSYTPISYERTYQMLDSITHSEIEPHGDSFNVAVFFDTDKISSNYTGGTWNQHMSVGASGGDFSNDDFIQVLEEGNPSPLYSNSGMQMFEQTSKWLEKNLPSIAMKVFAKYGITVIIT